MLASMAWANHVKEPVFLVGEPEPATTVMTDAEAGQPPRVRLGMPIMDSEHGMRLFAGKGCVVCHAINGVGEHDAKNLDAHSTHPLISAFAFSADMWAIGRDMVEAQERALGHRFVFTGDELADIIAFVNDDDQQHRFTEADIPPEVKKLMGHSHDGQLAHQDELGNFRPEEVYLVAPIMEPEQGMGLFAGKGCVVCHAVNGVGGHSAKNLNAHFNHTSSHIFMNPFDIAASMWAVTPGMIEARERVEGHRFLFTAEELSDIMAFVYDHERQQRFTEALIPPEIMKMMHHTHDGEPAHQEELDHDHGD
jgi:cytochrome c